MAESMPPESMTPFFLPSNCATWRSICSPIPSLVRTAVFSPSGTGVMFLWCIPS